MGGDKGDSTTTTTVELPPWMEQAFKQALDMADEEAKMGYVPYIGPDVAALSDPTLNAMQSYADTATLFGMAPQTDIKAGMPQPQEYAGGITGYSSFPMFEEAQGALATKYPGLDEYLRSFFIDPVTGKLPTNSPWNKVRDKTGRKPLPGGEPSDHPGGPFGGGGGAPNAGGGPMGSMR